MARPDPRYSPRPRCTPGQGWGGEKRSYVCAVLQMVSSLMAVYAGFLQAADAEGLGLLYLGGY